jgi:hypothetical protein
VRNVDQKVKAITADFNRKLGEDTAMYGRLDPAIKAANSAVPANIHDALGSIGPTLEGEATVASDALQGTMASMRAGADPAGSSGTSAMSRAEAADQALAGASPSRQAADRSAVDAFWSRYYGGFNAPAAGLAALPSPSPGDRSGHAVVAGKDTTSTGAAT